jgi:serine/threonine protein phosphatase PrpC
MKLSIHQPLGYTYQGGRSNNEDNIFPAADDATQHQQWFMVCDGVGGAARGEIASHIAVESFNDYFIQNQEPVATPLYIQSALDYVQTQFDDYLGRHPEGQGMATTLTMVFFHEAGATVAHIGDSRVYHLRDGKVIWRTEDHSLVNQLLKAGVISREEAREHPQRNVIERAIQGSVKPVKADVQILNDVRPGDYFFLCTDGVLERVSDELLENVLGTDASNEQKKQTLIDCCTGKTKDNFSAYLLQIETISGEIDAEYRVPPPVYAHPETVADETIAVVAVDSVRTAPVENNVPPQVVPEMKLNSPPRRASEEPTPNDKRQNGTDSRFLLLSVALLAAVLTMAGMYAYKQWKQPDESGTAEKVANQHRKANDQAGKPIDISKVTEQKPDTGPSHRRTREAIEGASEVIAEESDRIEISPNLFKKEAEGGWILENEKGKRIGNKVYDDIREPSNKFIAVKQNEKWGFITLTGVVAIKCQYDEANDFEKEKAHVMLNGKQFDIDKNGNKIDDQKTESESVNKTKLPNRPQMMALVGTLEDLFFKHLRS